MTFSANTGAFADVALTELQRSNTTQGAGMDKQIETKMIENTTGSLAVCLDKDSKFNGWVFSKHPDGKWVTKRLALPMEIKLAQDRLERLEISEGIPCRGGF